MNRLNVLSLIAVAATAVALLGTPAEAQLRPWEISIGGGPTTGTGNLGDVTETGYHVQGSVGLGIPLFPVGVRADLLWQELPVQGGHGDFRHIGGIANATLGMPLILIEPYVLAGVGMFRLSHSEGGEAETSNGFAVGAGIEGGLFGLKAFGEIRYLDAGHDHTTIPITVGIRF